MTTRGPTNRAVARVGSGRIGTFWLAGAAGLLLLGFAQFSCRRPSPEVVTLTFLDPERLYDLGQRQLITDTALKDFTRETGIQVNHLPTPETNTGQLALARKLLGEGTATVDVYGFDTIWSGMLSDYVVDLKPYFSAALPSQDPEVLANFLFQGKLVAMPYHENVGVLYYRTDLLHRYGYTAPPKTWDELEKMALRIQTGERARGDKDFWGYVWPGTDGEGLTCQGVEWQVDEGGGSIVEPDKRISVNNPGAIRAWERARHWVGWISPPTVVSYEEWDASNSFWVAGRAAFMRGWADYFLGHPPDVPFRDQAGVTSLPGGKVARVAALGGSGLAVSRSSAHRAEAIRLVEFLTRREAQIQAVHAHMRPAGGPEPHELPAILVRDYPQLARPGEIAGGNEVSRPSLVTGPKYDDVDQAYLRALHSVLTGKSRAQEAAAALEKELVRITGFAAEKKETKLPGNN